MAKNRSKKSLGSQESSTHEPDDAIFDVKPNITDVYHYGQKPDYIMLGIAILLAVAGGFGMPLSMIFFGDLFDGVGTSNADAIKRTCWILVCLGISVGVIMATATCLAELSVARQLKKMKQDFFKSLLSLDMGFYDENSESLFTKLNSAIVSFKAGAGHKLVVSIMMVSMFLAGFIIGFIRSWELTCVLLIPVPLMALGGFVWGKAMNSSKAKEEARNARANDIAEEAINSIKTVTAFGLEDEISSRYETRVDEMTKDAVKESILSSSMMGMVMGIMFLSYALGFWYSGVLIRREIKDPCCIYNPYVGDQQEFVQYCADEMSQGNLSDECQGVFAAFAGTDSEIRGPWYDVDWNECEERTCFSGGRALSVFFAIIFGAMGLGQSGPMINAFLKAAGSVTALKKLTSLPKPLDPLERKSSAKPVVFGDIEFKNVAFAYPTRPDTNIFTDLNITIAKGKTTALVGGSGCGKSTIIQLIERYYSQLNGVITSGGTKIDGMNISDWRDRIAIIPQEPRLFSLTIMENIRMGNREATDIDCIRAAMKANAHQFIMGFPEGYHTYVGTGGGQLSGGQKQRICIARALLKEPEILILDEATSALDNKSERIVQATLDEILKHSHRTTIVIAHRLSTIRRADNIIVLERDGNKGSSLKEAGSHSKLIKKEGVYRDLVKRQELEGLGELDLSQVHVAIGIDETELQKASAKMAEILQTKGTDTENKTAAEEKKHKKELKKAEKADTKKNAVPLGRVFADFLPGFRKFLVIAMFFALLNGAIFPVYSVIFSNFISIFYSVDADYIEDEAAKWALAFVGIAIGAFIVNAGQMHFFIRTSSNVQARLRKKTFRAVLYQDMSYHDEPDVNAGTLTEMLAKDVVYVAGIVSDNFGVQVQAASCLLISLGLAFWAQWQLALAGIFGAILTMIGGGLEMMLNTDMNMFTSDSDELEVGSGGFLFNETILNIRTIGAFNLQAYMIGRFDWVCDKEHGQDKIGSYIKAAATGLSQFLQFSANAFIFWIASILMDKDIIGSTQDDLRRFNIAIFALQMAGFGVAMAAMQGTDSTKGKRGAMNVYKVLDREPLVNTESKEGIKEDISKGKGSELQKVYFSYPTRKSVPIYDGVSVEIPIGKTTALVGSSGCGKSTAIQLLQRLYDPCIPQFDPKAVTSNHVDREDASVSSYSSSSDGETEIPSPVNYDDGPGSVIFYTAGNKMDAREAQVKSLRAQMGLVGQEPVLFDTSILENIRYGLKSATDEECIEAAKRANAHQFISGFDDGYQTNVGKMGSKLSGGQKQRIAIARALVRKPTLLLLDEATSALDSESEEIVQEALNKIMEESKGNLTVVVVAHRLSTIRNADQIVVFEPSEHGSKVVEVGTHEELVAKQNGVYRALCAATQH